MSDPSIYETILSWHEAGVLSEQISKVDESDASWIYFLLGKQGRLDILEYLQRECAWGCDRMNDALSGAAGVGNDVAFFALLRMGCTDVASAAYHAAWRGRVCIIKFVIEQELVSNYDDLLVASAQGGKPHVAEYIMLACVGKCPLLARILRMKDGVETLSYTERNILRYRKHMVVRLVLMLESLVPGGLVQPIVTMLLG